MPSTLDLHCWDSCEQRGWKVHPDGGLIGLGTSPSNTTSLMSSGSATGTEASNACVYGGDFYTFPHMAPIIIKAMKQGSSPSLIQRWRVAF